MTSFSGGIALAEVPKWSCLLFHWCYVDELSHKKLSFLNGLTASLHPLPRMMLITPGILATNTSSLWFSEGPAALVPTANKMTLQTDPSVPRTFLECFEMIETEGSIFKN